jgi:hypothetical protein
MIVLMKMTEDAIMGGRIECQHNELHEMKRTMRELDCIYPVGISERLEHQMSDAAAYSPPFLVSLPAHK